MDKDKLISFTLEECIERLNELQKYIKYTTDSEMDLKVKSMLEIGLIKGSISEIIMRNKIEKGE